MRARHTRSDRGGNRRFEKSPSVHHYASLATPPRPIRKGRPRRAPRHGSLYPIRGTRVYGIVRFLQTIDRVLRGAAVFRGHPGDRFFAAATPKILFGLGFKPMRETPDYCRDRRRLHEASCTGVAKAAAFGPISASNAWAAHWSMPGISHSAARRKLSMGWIGVLPLYYCVVEVPNHRQRTAQEGERHARVYRQVSGSD